MNEKIALSKENFIKGLSVYGHTPPDEMINTLYKVLTHSDVDFLEGGLEIDHYQWDKDYLEFNLNLKSHGEDYEIDYSFLTDNEDWEKVFNWRCQVAGFLFLSKMGNGDRWVYDLKSDDGNVCYYSHETGDISSYDVMPLDKYLQYLESGKNFDSFKFENFKEYGNPRNEIFQLTREVYVDAISQLDPDALEEISDKYDDSKYPDIFNKARELIEENS